MSDMQKTKMQRMVSIDLNSPVSSLCGVYQTKNGGIKDLDQNKKFRLKTVDHELKIYDKYFQKRVVKPVSAVQLGLAAVVLISQLSTTGLLIGPTTSSALSISDRIGVGIWTSIVSSLAAGATFWALAKTNFSRLHTSMMLHLFSFLGYVILEYLLLTHATPLIQERIYFLQQKISDVSLFESRRLLLITSENMNMTNDSKAKAQIIQMQAELNRLYASLVLTIIMAFGGILQVLSHFFMTATTMRAIHLGKTYLEGKLLQMQTIGNGWRTKSMRFDSKDMHSPKLERSDALPPPPYESGYFHPSLNA